MSWHGEGWEGGVGGLRRRSQEVGRTCEEEEAGDGARDEDRRDEGPDC